MSSSISSITPEADIMKTAQIMLEKGFKNYAVKYEQEIQGIITQKILCDAFIKIIQKEISN